MKNCMRPGNVPRRFNGRASFKTRTTKALKKSSSSSNHCCLYYFSNLVQYLYNSQYPEEKQLKSIMSVTPDRKIIDLLKERKEAGKKISISLEYFPPRSDDGVKVRFVVMSLFVLGHSKRIL